MADILVKRPVLGELLKAEQPDFLCREAADLDNSAGTVPVPLGTVLQKKAGGGVEPWDMASTPDPEDVYGLLLADVPAGVAARVAILISGPAAVDPSRLIWASDDPDKIAVGLEALKARKLIFTREPIATGTYPEQINPETVNP
jgi:hypothetical protein